MKFILITVFIILFTSCSFDNKTGIWKNETKITKKDEDKFVNFENLYFKKKQFNKIIQPSKNQNISLKSPKTNLEWLDKFYKNTNNSDNFIYKDLNKIIFKSKKLSRHEITDQILFDGQNIVVNDIKGNIIIYSIESQKIIYKYNFYKKKFKKIKKNLYTIINKNIIYVVDNFGYVYAINYQKQKVLWAKNYKIPFRSNIKILNNTIIASDINNTLYFINKNNGELLQKIPTEEVTIKSQFINSLSNTNESLFFLNTFGSIYSIGLNRKINWFVNINRSVDINTNNLFYSNPLTVDNNKILASTDNTLYFLNANNGSRIFTLPISSIVRPIISGNNIFLITNKNLLVCINSKNGEIKFSLDIAQEVADYLNTKKKTINIKLVTLINSKLYVFLENSYIVKFFAQGHIDDVQKLPSKISSSPIFINDSMIYINNSNRLIILD